MEATFLLKIYHGTYHVVWVGTLHHGSEDTMVHEPRTMHGTVPTQITMVLVPRYKDNEVVTNLNICIVWPR